MVNSSKTRRVKKRNSFIALMLVAALAITGALAYLTAKDSATNKFTVGNVDIDLTEPSWVEGNGENVVPGQVIAKDPTITNTGKNDAFVYLMVSVPKADDITVVDESTKTSTKVNDLQLFSYELDSGWTLVDSKIDNDDLYNYYLYAYNTALAPEAKTTPAFSTVKFANIAEGQFTEENNKLQILVDGYAIQSDFYNNEAGETATAASAWNLYVKQNNWVWPSNPATAHYSFVGYRRSPVKNVTYASGKDVITMPNAISTDFGDKSFAGWVDERGDHYTIGDTVEVEKLYINDKDTGEILNLYPRMTEIVSATFEGDNSELPVKLMPKNDICNTVINRGDVSETNANTLDSDGNRLYGEPTTTYPYTYADDSDWFVWGVEPGTTLQEFCDSYARVQGDGYMVVTPSNGVMIGTGSVIKVYDKHGTESEEDDTLVEQFTVVVYGDVNGDSTIDNFDASIVSNDSLRIIDRSFMLKAADIRRDNRINATDVSLICDHFANQGTINQVTGLIEY